jgi:hypothetical protein
MPTDTNAPGPKLRGIASATALLWKKRPSAERGSLTQQFFLKGEEQEASEYKNVPDVDALSPPEVEFDSFDEIPHKRRPLFATLGVLALAAIGAVGWHMVRRPPRPGSSVEVAAAAMVAATQPTSGRTEARAGAPASAMTAVAVPAVPVPAPVPEPVNNKAKAEAAPVPVVAEDSAPQPAPAAAPDPAAAPMRRARKSVPAPAIETKPTDQPAAADTTTDDQTVAAKPAAPTARPAPLRGYVWSPAAHALVPAARASYDSEPAVESSSATRAAQPATDPADPQPAAVDPDRSRSRESAPILE